MALRKLIVHFDPLGNSRVEVSLSDLQRLSLSSAERLGLHSHGVNGFLSFLSFLVWHHSVFAVWLPELAKGLTHGVDIVPGLGPCSSGGWTGNKGALHKEW